MEIKFVLNGCAGGFKRKKFCIQPGLRIHFKNIRFESSRDKRLKRRFSLSEPIGRSGYAVESPPCGQAASGFAFRSVRVRNEQPPPAFHPFFQPEIIKLLTKNYVLFSHILAVRSLPHRLCKKMKKTFHPTPVK